MNNEIMNILEVYPDYQDAIFRRGYLITSKVLDNLDSYPFYNNWNSGSCGSLNNGLEVNVYYHKLQHFYTYEVEGITASLIGHAYNPFDMKYQETEILKDCIEAYLKDEKAFFSKVSELTGIHLIILNDKNRLIFVQDCSGMKSCYFGKVKEDIYVTSHPQLVGDICNLKYDTFVKKLVTSRSYNIGNRHLPGNITPFRELKRLGGNTYVEYEKSFNINRFYPIIPHADVTTDEQFDKGIEEIVNILHRNIQLTTKKWQKPAISLSGGTDSKTTLACTHGLYENFSYFSFHCKPQEEVDAAAAHSICKQIGIDHTIHPIPEKNNEIKDFDVLKKIINHNTSYFMNLSDHEIRKMIFLSQMNSFDIELKSWVSEIGRCSLERRYEIKMPEVLTERHFSIFQTRYFLTPNLLKQSDLIYKKYLREIDLEFPLYNFEHTDLFHWEVRLGAWGTSVVSAFDFCHDVTMPFNNRRLIELFLNFPHEDRKRGNVHNAIIKRANSRIYDLNITITNDYSKSYRQKLEQVYYLYRTAYKRNKRLSTNKKK